MLAEHLDQFYEHAVLRNVSPKTLSNLKGQLQAFSRDFPFKNSNLLTILSKDLSEYVIAKCEGKSADLFKAKVWALRQFFGYLVLKGVLNVSPADVLKHAKYPKREKLQLFAGRRDANPSGGFIQSRKSSGFSAHQLAFGHGAAHL